MRWLLVLCLLIAVLAVGPAIAMLTDGRPRVAWHQASRQPAHIAPDPATTQEAVIQVYAARAFGWRGAVAVHSWIAAKPAGAAQYTVYQVIGWRFWSGRPALSIAEDVPDRYWFGGVPEVVAELRGDGVDAVIAKLDAAARRYPYADTYKLWPGPNSNTFTAWIGRQVPELRMSLPPTAIGKDFMGDGIAFGPAPSNTGYQVSIYGALGLLVAAKEGLEVNLFGACLGIDPLGLAIKLPGLGRVGLLAS